MIFVNLEVDHVTPQLSADIPSSVVNIKSKSSSCFCVSPTAQEPCEWEANFLLVGPPFTLSP